MKIIFPIVLSLYASLIMGQPSVNEQYVEDSLYFYDLNDSAAFYQYQNAEKREEFASKMMAFAKEKSNPFWIAKALVSLGGALVQKGGQSDLETAILKYKEAINLYETLKDFKSVGICYNGLSLCYKDLGYFSEAVEASTKSLEILKSVDDTPHKYLGNSYANLANRYLDLSLHDLAANTFDTALYYFEKADYMYGVYGIYLNKSRVYELQKKYDKALMSCFQAYEGFKEIKVKQGQIKSARGLEHLYRVIHRPRESIRYAKKGLRIIGTRNFQSDKICFYRGLAENFLELNQLDSALGFIDPAIQLADSLQLFSFKQVTLELKARILEQQGDSLAALHFYGLASVVEDSLEQRNNIFGATKIIIDKEKEQHQQEVSGFQYMLTRTKQWLAISLIIVVLLGVIGLFAIRRWLNLRKEQIQLANTLNTEKAQNQRTLVTKEASLAVKDDLLREVSLLLEKVKAHNGNTWLDQDVNETQKLIKHNLELSKMWDDFFIRFEKVHPEFIELLTSKYNLTPNDLRICAFIKMNLSNKEISALLHIRLNTLYMTISRIKQKLQIPKDTSVFDFLHSKKFYNSK